MSLIYDKIGGCCLLSLALSFTEKMEEEEEEMRKGKRGGRLTDYNLKTTMDSPTDISNECIFLGNIVYNNNTLFLFLFFIPSFSIVIPSVYTDIKLL